MIWRRHPSARKMALAIHRCVPGAGRVLEVEQVENGEGGLTDPGKSRSDMECYFRGEKLYGDDFSLSEIEGWFEDEKNGYYNLDSRDRTRYVYGYHALNMHQSFRYLPSRDFSHVLGVGSAYGEELLPMLSRIQRITILEPAEGFVVRDIKGVPVEYVKPSPQGILPFPDESFDLLICFSVLHHIPNVSTVVKEFCRCLKLDGYALLREPIISMGDWRRPRKGLTPRERGIPLEVFRKIILSSGFEILHERKCVFSLTSRLRYFLKRPVFNSRLVVLADAILCKLPVWPKVYHPKFILQKLRPTAVSYVLHKGG